MKILLVDNGTSLLKKLKELVPGHEITKTFNEITEQDTDDFDLIILSGGGHHNVLHNNGEFDKEKALIKSGKPIIGICFGCELIAYTYGAELRELSVEQKGVYDIELIDKNLGGPRIIGVYEGHTWIIDKLPENFDVLAKSDVGPEIIKHKELPMYGLQFHPENMVEETDGDELFIKLLNRF